MDEHEARTALRTAGLDASAIREIVGGWAYWTFDIDDTWIIRFPRSPESADAARRELALLPELARSLSFQVPTPSHRGEWKGWPFLAYPKIQGRALDRTDGSTQAFQRLGQMLRETHAFPVDRAAALLGTGPPERAWTDHLERLWPRIEQFALPHMSVTTAALVSSEFDRFIDDVLEIQPTLIHNDLGLEHLLVSTKTGTPQGIIDWEKAWVGDPAVDFVPLAAAFGSEGLDQILGTRDLGAGLKHRMWFYRWIGSIHAIIYGVTRGIAHERDSGLSKLQVRLHDRPD